MNPTTSREDRERQRSEIAAWKKIVAPFEKPSIRLGLWQAASTLTAYFATWAAMLLLQPVSWWLVAPLILLAGGLLVRIFIIFHDCCHGSFLPWPKVNQALGTLTGILVFTPFRQWRWEHNIHHASSGDLDRRGVGDVWTMTVAEYQASGWWRRLAYRTMRNPVVLFGILPVLLFVVRERFSTKGASPAAKRSLWLTNLCIAAVLTAGCLLFGAVPFLIIQLGVITVAASGGVWMFYVQHQFEDVYWERHHDWEYTSAALLGSSFYKLPRVLQWFTGNIGFHHVHHLSSKIPNYYLERCHNSHKLFHDAPTLTLFSSLNCLRFRLWDETSRRLISFGAARRLASAA